MMEVIVPWCVGVVIFGIALYFLGLLFYPALYLDVEDRFFWVSAMVETAFTTTTTSIFLSLPIVAAVGITYGCYRLGRAVIGWLF